MQSLTKDMAFDEDTVAEADRLAAEIVRKRENCFTDVLFAGENIEPIEFILPEPEFKNYYLSKQYFMETLLNSVTIARPNFVRLLATCESVPEKDGMTLENGLFIPPCMVSTLMTIEKLIRAGTKFPVDEFIKGLRGHLKQIKEVLTYSQAEPYEKAVFYLIERLKKLEPELFFMFSGGAKWFRIRRR